MRWPFHFGSSAQKRATPEPARRTEERSWASLPPIQRTIGGTELTARSLEFSRALPGSEEAALSLQPLGHHRSPDGPRGIVAGIADPIEPYAGTAELIGRPRRRNEPAPAAKALFGEITGTGPVEVKASDPVERSVLELPARVLPAAPVETPSATSSVGRLTDASNVQLGPLGPVQRSPEVAAPPHSAKTGSTAVESRPPAPAPFPMRPNLGLSRRLGLGAPIRGADLTAQRSTAAPTPPSAPESPSPAQTPVAELPRAAPAAPPSSPDIAGVTHGDVATRSEQPRGPLPLLHAVGKPGGAEPAEVAEGREDARPKVRATATPALQETRAASMPSGVSLTPQRLAGSGTPRAVAVPLPLGRPSNAALRPAGDPELSSQGGRLPQALTSLTGMPPPAAQASAALRWDVTGGLGGVVAPRAFRSPEHHPFVWNVQRAAAGEAPASESPTGPRELPTPGESASAVSESTSGPAPAPPAAAVPAAGGTGVETAPGAAEAPAAGAGAPAAGAAPTARGEKELHELAHALFPLIMALIRMEVLIERERAGFITDLR